MVGGGKVQNSHLNDFHYVLTKEFTWDLSAFL